MDNWTFHITFAPVVGIGLFFIRVDKKRCWTVVMPFVLLTLEPERSLNG